MRRRLKQIAIGSCLVMALVSVGLYVLTHWRSDSWTLFGPTTCRIEFAHGSVTAIWARTNLFGAWWDRPTEGGLGLGETELPPWPDMDPIHSGSWHWPKSVHAPLGARLDWRNGEQAAGFDSSAVDERLRKRNSEGRAYDAWIETHDRRILVVPLLLIALLAMLPVLAALFRALARRELPAGSCIGCGYDLRHSTDRCPECGRLFADRKPLRVGLIAPLLAAGALLLAGAIFLATLSANRGIIVSATHVPAMEHSWPAEERPRVRILEFALWVEDRTILLAESHDVTDTVNLPIGSLAASAVPPLTQLPVLEPTFRVIPDGNRSVHVLRLPIWLALLLLLGGVAIWITRVHRRGGFRIRGPEEMPSAADIPAPSGGLGQ